MEDLKKIAETISASTQSTRGDVSLTPEFTFRNPEQIAVLEILVRNRNSVFQDEYALILYSANDPSLVTVEIIDRSTRDAYYFNNCQPENLLILDRVGLVVEEAHDKGDHVTTTVKVHDPIYKLAIGDTGSGNRGRSAYGEAVNREDRD